jgi:hypothetical protein
MTPPARSYEPPAWFALAEVKPETEAAKRRRMAELIRRLVTATGSVTHDELLGSFEQADIDMHYRPALKLAGVHRLAGVI